MENSHFGRLSPELRNTIYSLALFERRPVAVSKNFSVEPPLLRLCKQIRQEAELIFYAINDFSATAALEQDSNEWLLRWLSVCPMEKIELVKTLTIRVETPGQDWTDDQTQEDLDPSTSRFSESPLAIALRKCSFGKRPFEQVVQFTMNGQGDDLSLDEVMRTTDRRRRGMHFIALMMMLETAYGVDVRALLILSGTQMLRELQQKLREKRQKTTTVEGRVAADFRVS
ncbi:hypothetical protein LTR37_009258 [Vermiconidia calcicola]|uniref:Uncharacterized protein n=1 Tax=Vermiconidia calcicola TaxID=1690605 RepID=A0ACC3N8U2_9PEZI|nr:hypothetical protein LTR37_009258 [Vermiconidia calcicola]